MRPTSEFRRRNVLCVGVLYVVAACLVMPVAGVEADLAQQLENVRATEKSGELPTLDSLKAALTLE